MLLAIALIATYTFHSSTISLTIDIENKLKSLLLFLLIITSPTAFAQRDDFRLYLTTADRFGSDDPALFGLILARQYNLNESAIGGLLTKFNRNWGDLALGLEMGRLSKKPVNTVIGAYEKNPGWGNIAKDLGIKPGSADFHQMKREMRQRKIEWSREWNKKISPPEKNGKKMFKKSAPGSKGKR